MEERKLPEPKWTDTHIIEVEDGTMRSKVVRREKDGYEFEHSQSFGGGIGSEEEMIAFGHVVQQIHNARIPTVVTTGTTGKSLRYAFRAAWRRLYPNEPMPGLFHFPQRILEDSLPSGNNGTSKPKIGPREKYPKLTQKLDKPVVILDDFVDSGGTLGDAKEVLERMASGKKPEIKTAAIFAERMEFQNTRIGKLDFCGQIKKLERLTIYDRREIGYWPNMKTPGFHGTRREIHQEIREAIRKRREQEAEQELIAAKRGYRPPGPLPRAHITRTIRPDLRIHRVRMEAFGEMAASHIIAQRQSMPRQPVQPTPPRIRRTFVRHSR
ncbi:MAG: hypothetical protein NT067_07345 [Candidatus Diapherotrites archaeon]|nr:hypothetical protein [Candidatus Diapherotrites archaeon]